MEEIDKPTVSVEIVVDETETYRRVLFVLPREGQSIPLFPMNDRGLFNEGAFIKVDRIEAVADDEEISHRLFGTTVA